MSHAAPATSARTHLPFGIGRNREHEVEDKLLGVALRHGCIHGRPGVEAVGCAPRIVHLASTGELSGTTTSEAVVNPIENARVCHTRSNQFSQQRSITVHNPPVGCSRLCPSPRQIRKRPNPIWAPRRRDFPLHEHRITTRTISRAMPPHLPGVLPTAPVFEDGLGVCRRGPAWRGGERRFRGSPRGRRKGAPIQHQKRERLHARYPAATVIGK
jgi:hypothetical protein